jgi:hypothetical protein
MRIVPGSVSQCYCRKEISRNARECLQLAERATEPDVKKSLIELSIWMEAALERHIFDERAPNAVAK